MLERRARDGLRGAWSASPRSVGAVRRPDGGWRLALTRFEVRGGRVMIYQLEHSPAMTRECGSALIGRCGEIVLLLRVGGVAVVELEDWGGGFPRGVRRWSVSLDDLSFVGHREPAGRAGSCVRRDALLTGISGFGSRIVRHAVWPDEVRGLCGKPVRPLTFTGWFIPFSPSAPRRCADCVDLARLDDTAEQGL